ncbi:MAG: alanine racemase [Caldilineaceae bacterium]|nr:alanine racemase [Caldilineaceae bacterium]
MRIGVVVELNTGMERAGVQPGAPALELAKAVHSYPGLELRGLMTWEGHTIGITPEADKRAAIAHSIGQLRDTVDLVRQAGLPVEIVSCGGSGTFAITAHEAGITEIQAGGVIFNDIAYARVNVPTKFALFVHTVVTSRPAPDRIIVDGGFKTMPRWSNPPRPIGMDGVADVVCSAEHGIITLDHADDTIAVGDRFDFIPGYGDHTSSCMTTSTPCAMTWSRRCGRWRRAGSCGRRTRLRIEDCGCERSEWCGRLCVREKKPVGRKLISTVGNRC